MDALHLRILAPAAPSPRWLHDTVRLLRRRHRVTVQVVAPAPQAPASLAWRAAQRLDVPAASGRAGLTPVEVFLNLPGWPPRLLAQRQPPTLQHSVRANVEHACARLPELVAEAVEVAGGRRGGRALCAAHPTPCASALGPIARSLARRLRPPALRGLRPEQWLLAWTDAPLGPDFLPRGLHALVPPRDALWADPFVIAHRGGHEIFFEELAFSRGRGRISRLRLEGGRVVEGPLPVLESPGHLSYPFLFRWRGALFMLPESSDSGRAVLWRCTRFPDVWTQEAVALEVALHDASVVEVEGRWWLFACQAPQGALPYDELHLYHAASPLGPWTPHRCNPVKSDARDSRPAGAPFLRGARLFRPAQDCTRYGSRTRVMEVSSLSLDAFAEREVACLKPDWLRGGLGQHTLNSDAGLVVVDAMRRRPLTALF